jgi:hypothetical protein
MKTMLVFLSVFLIVATAVFAVDCAETDQGRSTGVFGTCTDSLGVHNDECLGGFLKEWACEGNSCARTYEACASGCSAGACIGDQPSAAAKCSEDDKGQDFYTAGSCYDPSSHPDYCIGGDGKTQIREWYCKNDACAYTESTCPIGYVCKGTPGACVRSGVLPSKCTETDGGKNFEAAGTCKDKNGNKTDACYRGKYVQEFFCKSDLCRTEYKLCKYGCVDGRCLSQATTITTSTTTTIFPNKCTYAGERKCLGLGLMECQMVNGGYLDWVRIEQLSQQCCTGESCCKETDGGINDFYTPGSVTGFSYEKKYAQWNDKCEYLVVDTLGVGQVDTLQFPNGTVKLELVGANSDSNTATLKVDGISRTVKEGSEIEVMGSYIYINSIFTYNIPAPGAALEYFYPGKGENMLVEYGCEKDYARLAVESCDYGCNGGACLKARNDDLMYYPKMYSDSGVFVVVGKNANSFDIVLAINISKSLQKAGIKVSAVKLDSEVIDPLNENLISVDGACVNSVSASLMGNPANCADGLEEGKGKIKLFNNNGKAQIMVVGWEQSDLKLAGAVLVNYMRYNLSGKEYIVTATYPCIPAGSKGSYSKKDACCEGLNRISNSLVINGSQCAYPRTPDDTFVCANCPDGKCGLGENKCNCEQDCKNCAAEGQEYSKVWTSEYPSNCCEGLTEWARGFDTREVVNGVCVSTDQVSGYPVGLCINCGNGVCEKDENVCNCEQDCGKGCINDGEKGSYTQKDVCCEGLKRISNAIYTSEGLCAELLPDATFVCAKCSDGNCGLGENPCNCKADCGNCAAEGQEYSKVWTSEYPSNCCAGLTEWARGFDTRKVVDGVCVSTDQVSGYPVGLCINCGNGVCEKDENICNCEKDCGEKKCAGCLYESKCLPIGLRLKTENGEVYCDFNYQLEAQRANSAECYNAFECKSNTCADGACISLKAIVEQGNSLLWRVWCKVSNLASESGYKECLAQ